MSRWTEYDPLYGVKETNIADGDTGVVTVHKQQDVEGLLDRNKSLANEGATNIGIQKGLWHYATIPLVVQYDLLKRGINVHSKSDRAKLLDVLNSEYPQLKTTHKTHSLRRNKPTTKATTPKAGPLLIVR